MKELPKHVSAYKRTPKFDEDTVPNALLKSHRTKENVWGKIVILDGKLEYTIDEPKTETITLDKQRYGVVEPTVLHTVKPLGHVRFYVEFFR